MQPFLFNFEKDGTMIASHYLREYLRGGYFIPEAIGNEEIIYAPSRIIFSRAEAV